MHVENIIKYFDFLVINIPNKYMILDYMYYGKNRSSLHCEARLLSKHYCKLPNTLSLNNTKYAKFNNH